MYDCCCGIRVYSERLNIIVWVFFYLSLSLFKCAIRISVTVKIKGTRITNGWTFLVKKLIIFRPSLRQRPIHYVYNGRHVNSWAAYTHVRVYRYRDGQGVRSARALWDRSWRYSHRGCCRAVTVILIFPTTTICRT